MTSHQRPERTGEYPLECVHCQYPIPDEPIETDDGYVCSTACHEAADEEGTMPDPGAYKRIVTGVEPLDSLVPNGIPADAMVELSGEAGTRRSELLTELVWRAIDRGEPAVVVTVATPPTAILERFFETGWNVLPALEDDRLRIVDCFTHRLADPEEFHDRRSEWVEFVGETAADSIESVEEPDDPEAIRAALTGALDDLEMTETGLVTIESLDELGRHLEDGGRHELLAEIRASISKARYVPIVAGTTPGHGPALEDSLTDGVVDLRLVDHPESETRHRQLAVRKLTGARHLPQWLAYEYEPARGLVALGSTDTGRAAGAGPTPRSVQGQ